MARDREGEERKQKTHQATTAGSIAGAAAGAALGSVAPGVGTAVGAALGGIAGAVVGGAVGAAIGVRLHPDEEDRYWRENFFSLPYASGSSYHEFAPAFRLGWESRARGGEARFEEIEPELEERWRQARGASSLDWSRARLAARDAWRRADERVRTASGPGRTR